MTTDYMDGVSFTIPLGSDRSLSWSLARFAQSVGLWSVLWGGSSYCVWLQDGKLATRSTWNLAASKRSLVEEEHSNKTCRFGEDTRSKQGKHCKTFDVCKCAPRGN